jgi:acyl-CoA synthetase (AMP-forming)/AMP-acid ligase II
MQNIYNQDLDKVTANSQLLTPINFLNRTAEVYPDRVASALIKRGVKPGNTIAMLAANIPAFLEAHYGVPLTGAVLNSINIRLDAQSIAFIFDHAECDVLFTDTAFSSVVKKALTLSIRQPLIIDIDDFMSEGGERLGANSVYLWTLPIFHCNGWCFPWSIVAMGGTQVCLRQVKVGAIVESLVKHKITHFCDAPIVLNMILNADKTLLAIVPRGINVMTASYRKNLQAKCRNLFYVKK